MSNRVQPLYDLLTLWEMRLTGTRTHPMYRNLPTLHVKGETLGACVEELKAVIKQIEAEAAVEEARTQY
jgi:hypothetical protein